MKSLPYTQLTDNQALKQLRCLELKRIDIHPDSLMDLIQQNSTSLKELYLNEVYLKIISPSDSESALWVGHGSDVPKSSGAYWIAEELRDMKTLQLDIFRVTGLGYDDYEPENAAAHLSYDLEDPSGLDRSFDERFIEIYMGLPPPPRVVDIQPTDTGLVRLMAEDLVATDLEVTRKAMRNLDPRELEYKRLHKWEYDVETFQRDHNTTSHWKRCIDGLFYNHNEKALFELQKIIAVADRGMSLLSDEIDRIHTMTTIPREER
jgi:Fe-S-cluster formation regulator IscX/YfhJ